jgi:hypothetical protein
MAFEPKDNNIYDELWDVTVAAAVTKGQAVVRQDVFGFYFTAVTADDITNSNNEVAFIYRMRQVLADKATGTGEAIVSGDRLYYYPANDNVSPTATGTAGTDYYFCGWAKKSVAAATTTVLMNFDGTRYDEAV